MTCDGLSKTLSLSLWEYCLHLLSKEDLDKAEQEEDGSESDGSSDSSNSSSSSSINLQSDSDDCILAQALHVTTSIRFFWTTN